MDHADLRFLSRIAFITIVTSIMMACGGSNDGPVTPTPTATPAPVLTLELGAPTSNPIVIPPSTSATTITFLSVVSGTQYPDQLVLDQVDKAGNLVLANVLILKDDGEGADAFRGDRTYAGGLSIGSVASEERYYRARADNNGSEISSGIGRFWISGCPPIARPSNPEKLRFDTNSDADIYINELLVTLTDAVAPQLSDINAILAEAGGQVVGCVPALRQYLVEIANNTTVEDLYASISLLESLDQVDDVSPNVQVVAMQTSSALPCDGQECQWYMERIRAPEAWSIAGGGDEQQAVAVIDFGVNCNHLELDCHNSLINDDSIDHGTGVAGLIAAQNDDNTALVGVAWNTEIYSYSLMGGVSTYKMIEAITQSIDEPNIKVINISAGVSYDANRHIQSAVCTAIDSGRLVVAAAGNAGLNNDCESDYFYPGRYNAPRYDAIGACGNMNTNLARGLLLVGATDADNNLSEWSDGLSCSNRLNVDIFAPGSNIFTASNTNGYVTKNGTSFASPLVAGSAAVLWAAQPSLTVSEVHDQLINSAGTLSQNASDPRYLTDDPRLEGERLLDLFSAVGGSDEIPEPDRSPEFFSLIPLLNARLNSYLESNTITIRGINISIPIDIEGGFYSIDGGPFTNAAGTINENQTLVIQIKSAKFPDSSRQASINIGDLNVSFQVTTVAADTQPDNFDFIDVENAALSSEVISNTLNIPGINAATPIEISGGFYAIGGGAFTDVAGTVAADQAIRLRVTAANTPATVSTATVTIGGVSDNFSVETVAADIDPSPFAFSSQTDVAINSEIISNAITVSGINTNAPISVSAGEYSIDGGSFRNDAANVQNGQSVRVRHNSANAFSASTFSTLAIGSFNTTFRSTTITNTAPTAINVSVVDLNGNDALVGDTLSGSYTFTDAENDLEGSTTYRWLRNDIAISGATSTNYLLLSEDSGQGITFEVTPIALTGELIGIESAVLSNRITVSNSPPSVININIVDVNGASLSVGDILSVAYDYQDADNDVEGISTFIWLRNGVAINGATDLSYQLSVSDAAQLITVSVTPVALSGETLGSSGLSSAVVTGNVPPVAINLDITGDVGGSAIVGDTLNATYNYTDVDGDSEAISIYQWTRNSIPISGATALTYTVAASDSGQNIVFTVTPLAASGSATGSLAISSAVLVNTVPTAQNVTINDGSSGSFVVGDTLSGTYDYSDSELDLEGISTFRWLRNGITEIGTTTTYTVTAADSGEELSFEITPIASTGSLNGVTTISAARTINNSAPTASNVTIDGESLELGNTLSGNYNFADVDGDSEGATTFRWVLNNLVTVSTAQNYTVGAEALGQELSFEVTPRASSGVITGTAIMSSGVLIPAGSEDTTPDAFSFNPQLSITLRAAVTSNAITVSGINSPTIITIDTGEYRINGGIFTSIPGLVNSGNSVEIRLAASASLDTETLALLTIGGVSGEFSVGSQSLEWISAAKAIDANIITQLADGAVRVDSADLDGDGDIDVVSASEIDGSIIWYESDGNPVPNFSERIISSTAPLVNYLSVADIDGDGDLDILASTELDGAGSILWYANDGASPPTFSQRVITSGPTNIRSLTSADIDGDGDMDILTAWGSSEVSVAWYENDGASVPNFSLRVVTTIADGVRSLSTADIDGDGDLDLISASTSDENLTWYENDGNTTPNFTQRNISASTDYSAGVSAADMDGDGDIDLVSFSPADSTITWYENNGASQPIFTKRVIAQKSDTLTSISAVDVDGDGDIDVLYSASYGISDIAWFENDGAVVPNFIERNITTTGASVRSLTTADINGDGKLEILSASYTDDTIAWYSTTQRSEWVAQGASLNISELAQKSILNPLSYGSHPGLDAAWFSVDPASGAVSFTAPAPGSEPQDANRDNVYEIRFFATDSISTINRSIAVRVYVDDADDDDDGTPDTNDAFPLNPSEQVDTDGDGIGNNADNDDDEDEVGDALDNAPLDNSSSAIPQWVTAAEPVTTNLISELAVKVSDLHAVDIDNDGDIDVLAAYMSDIGITWYENDGATVPDFSLQVVASSAIIATAVDSADIDGDGDIDILVAASDDNVIAWYEHDGAADPSFTEQVITSSAMSVSALASDDIDGDGDIDILAATPGNNTLVWYQNDGATTPSFTARSISVEAFDVSSVTTADIDGDGDIDLLYSAQGTSNSLMWFENDGATLPSFTPHLISNTAYLAASIATGDIDNDGDIDVISSSSLASIAWYENNGDSVPSFTENLVTSIGHVTMSLEVSDLDGDGDLDVLSASFANNTIAWHENDAATRPNFIEHSINSNASGASAVTAADLNGDGIFEVLSGAELDNTIAWYTTTQRTATVTEGNTLVISENASDTDSNTLIYSVSHGADETFFSVNTATGDITFANAPPVSAPEDDNGDNVYEVSINVSDGFSIITRSIEVTVLAI